MPWCYFDSQMWNFALMVSGKHMPKHSRGKKTAMRMMSLNVNESGMTAIWMRRYISLSIDYENGLFLWLLKKKRHGLTATWLFIKTHGTWKLHAFERIDWYGVARDRELKIEPTVPCMAYHAECGLVSQHLKARPGSKVSRVLRLVHQAMSSTSNFHFTGCNFTRDTGRPGVHG